MESKTLQIVVFSLELNLSLQANNTQMVSRLKDLGSHLITCLAIRKSCLIFYFQNFESTNKVILPSSTRLKFLLLQPSVSFKERQTDWVLYLLTDLTTVVLENSIQ